jgi:hypothetical protein
MNVTQMIDLDRYNILDLESEGGRELLAQCRTQIGADGACNLVDFIRPEAVLKMAEEANTLLSKAYVKDLWRNAFFLPDAAANDEGDPRFQKFHLKLAQVAADQIPAVAAIRRIYEWDPLKEFISAVLRMPRLYRMADPYQCLNYTYLRDRDVQPWHFDQNVFTITLLLQAAEIGGDFEYAPKIRPRGDGDLSAIKALFSGDISRVKRLDRSPGTLTLFLGEFSAHRVTEVRGPTPRITAILAYDEVPNRIAPMGSNVMQYGPRILQSEKKSNA